jgi:two-component system cell cycle response regulator
MAEDARTVGIDLKKYREADFLKKVPVLTCMTGDQVGRWIMLANDQITLGRSGEATIMLRDKHASRLHLAITYEPDKNGYRIKDLGSFNGTLLNDIPVSEGWLKNGDKLIIGETMLRFTWEDAMDLRYYSEIDQLMNIDELTSLVVKRRFDEELNRHVAVAKNQNTPLAMMMMDMDGIKQINDTHGHAFGAYAISETGKIIKAAIGQKGLASRFGGDEFMAFLLPNTAADEAARIAEQIRNDVETYKFVKNGIRISPTICIGISILDATDRMESLIERADEALYQSKRSGRNRVTLNASN